MASFLSIRAGGCYEAANVPKSLLVIQGADHNDDPLQAGREMIEGVLQFLDANVNY